MANFEIPEAVKLAIEKNPELVAKLANAEVINSINDQLSKRAGNADWCLLCGASHGARPGNDVINPPTIEEIQEIGRRLLSINK